MSMPLRESSRSTSASTSGPVGTWSSVRVTVTPPRVVKVMGGGAPLVCSDTLVAAA
eukprot:CAMPEP_0113723822 /NCGR_PEP_ID=MMETSP0038_2-20120614/38682_1 /TAXON_ID=2898 /ORGANISM="Cryptomonas paramecium" /LENGTH=55 /DNA_ID=CAMNT_0000653545 /DNA_START=17 /DNA_END=180 /DNA_ORIENTATION=- /assembly_acc=CAM_ASM_000170